MKLSAVWNAPPLNKISGQFSHFNVFNVEEKKNITDHYQGFLRFILSNLLFSLLKLWLEKLIYLEIYSNLSPNMIFVARKKILLAKNHVTQVLLYGKFTKHDKNHVMQGFI